jgi:hypothetical protein
MRRRKRCLGDDLTWSGSRWKGPDHDTHVKAERSFIRIIEKHLLTTKLIRLAIPLSVTTFCKPIIIQTSFFVGGYVDDGRLSLGIYGKPVVNFPNLYQRNGIIQAWNASRPFSRPMPLSFIPPLQCQL